MRILNLQAENIKRLIAVDITPEGNTIKISGKNGAGKTSVLDCIYWALAGTEAIQEQPIREGQDEANIRLDLGKYIVERTFKEGGKTTLKISSPDGARFSSPQALIDGLLGTITFDPLEFSRMAPKKQAEVIKGIAKFEVDLDQLDALNKADYDLRRDLNRDIKELDAQISGIKIPEGTPEAAVDIFKKTTDYNTALDKNREIVSLQGKVRVTEEGIYNLEGQVKTLQDRIKQGQDILEDYKNKLEEAKKQFSDEQKIEALKTEIAQAETLNRGVALREQKDGKKKDLKAKEDQVETLNKAMAAREKQKAETIAKAKLPIEGLSLTDGAVTFNGLPLEQCSSAEQLRISTAIAIASNPELRVLRIKDGALLDSDSLAILEKMAIEHDFQMWIERVGEEPLSVVIEEGRVKKAGA